MLYTLVLCNSVVVLCTRALCNGVCVCVCVCECVCVCVCVCKNGLVLNHRSGADKGRKGPDGLSAFEAAESDAIKALLK
uniref:Uncharacterized protein n=1 Tax=Cyprinus carpio TaxID=7962 RepID=A0A8C1STR5_CYPCA